MRLRCGDGKRGKRALDGDHRRGTFGGVRGHLEIFAKAGLQRAQVAMKKAVERKLAAECAKITRKNARASK